MCDIGGNTRTTYVFPPSETVGPETVGQIIEYARRLFEIEHPFPPDLIDRAIEASDDMTILGWLAAMIEILENSQDN